MNKHDLTIMGRVIGVCDGWDQSGDTSFVFYEFEPKDGVDLPAGDINFDWDSGKFSYYADNGDLTEEFDAITALTPITPREAS